MALKKRAIEHSVLAIGNRENRPSRVFTLATMQILKSLAWEGPAGENSIFAREKV